MPLRKLEQIFIFGRPGFMKAATYNTQKTQGGRSNICPVVGTIEKTDCRVASEHPRACRSQEGHLDGYGMYQLRVNILLPAQ